jgi:hypothetical protein
MESIFSLAVTRTAATDTAIPHYLSATIFHWQSTWPGALGKRDEREN